MILPLLLSVLLVAAPPAPKEKAKPPEKPSDVYFFPKSGTPLVRAVRVGDAAYALGKPHVLIDADVDDLHVSPDKRYVLAICRYPRREPFDHLLTPDAPKDYEESIPRVMRPRTGTVSLVLWDAVRDRVSVLWKREAGADEQIELGDLSWLSDNKTAMAQVSLVTFLPEKTRLSGGKEQKYRPKSVDTSLMIIAANQKNMRLVPLVTKTESVPQMQIVPSPVENRVLLTIVPNYGDDMQMRFATPNGELSDSVLMKAGFAFLSGWTESGRITGFAMSNKRSGWDGSREVSIDGRTGEITLKGEPKRGGEATATPEMNGVRTLTTPVYLAPATGTIAASGSDDRKIVAQPLFLRSTTDSAEGVFVAPQGQPVGVLGADGAYTALYVADDALYGVTLRKVPLDAYEDSIRTVARQRASALKTQLAVWRLQHDNLYPAPGTDIAALFGENEYGRISNDADKVAFQDPATDKPAFTYLYKGESGTDSVPLFSFGTLGGRYVFYDKGYEPHWIAGNAPIPATEPSAKP